MLKILIGIMIGIFIDEILNAKGKDDE